jgi:peptide/nickel transport system permease protein
MPQDAALVAGLERLSVLGLIPPRGMRDRERRSRIDQMQIAREELGLNDPFHLQFINWFGGVLRGDLGQSIMLNMSVSEALLQRAQPTGLLTLYALLISIVIGVPSGIIAAVKQNSIVDRVVMMFAISGVAIPSFVLGILLILIFAVFFRWLPSGGYVALTDDPRLPFQYMIMPAFSLGFSAAGLLARLVRLSMLDVLNEDYIRTAVAKGLRFRLVVTRHALRNALIPAVTVIGYSLGTLLGGAVVTEQVFNVPGMGRLVVQSVLRRDFPVVQGAVMTIAVFYVLANLIVDVLYIYIDPRIRYGN